MPSVDTFRRRIEALEHRHQPQMAVLEWPPFVDAYRARCEEIHALVGATPVVLWVARYQAQKAMRSKQNPPPLPTHEQALTEIEAGRVDYATQPECLRRQLTLVQPEPDFDPDA